MLLIGKPAISMDHLYHGYVKQPEGVYIYIHIIYIYTYYIYIHIIYIHIIYIHILYIYTQCEAPKIAKLVYNSNNYGLWYL